MPKRWSPRSAMPSTSTATPSPARRRPPSLRKVTLVCGKARGQGRAGGLARGQAMARRRDAGARMRQPPGQPLHADATWPSRRKKLGKELRPQGRGARPQGRSRSSAWAPSWRWPRARDEPPRFIVAALPRAPPRAQAPVVLVGKGITFDTGGISHQARGRDGRDEVRHGRRGQRAGHAARAWPSCKPKLNVVGVIPACENMPERPRHQAGRRGHQHVGPDHRDPQHRRRRPPDPVRRADLRRALQAGGGGRHRHADRRLRDRAGPPPLAACSPPTTRWPPSCSPPAERRSTRLAHAARRGVRRRPEEQLRRHGQRRPARRRRHHRGHVPASASPASTAGPTSTSPARPGSRARPRARTGRPVPLLTHFVLSQRRAERRRACRRGRAADDRGRASTSTCPTGSATPAGCCARRCARGARVVVIGADGDAGRSSTGSCGPSTPLDFVPHVAARPAQPLAPRCATRRSGWSTRRTTRRISEVLLNLGDELPAGFERFARVIEIVSHDDPDATRAAARWRHYADRGYAITGTMRHGGRAMRPTPAAAAHRADADRGGR